MEETLKELATSATTASVEVVGGEYSEIVRSLEEKETELRALESDPWDGVEDKLKPGEWYDGVISGLADFGAFVELLPGVRGLIHVSALAQERVYHPGDVVKEGQQVSVRVVEIDKQRKRISLSLLP